jgi:hypothetical protein
MSSAFKQLYSEMFKSDGASPSTTKSIKCYVKESFPYFLVTDGYFFVPAYFTKKAVDEFQSKFSNLSITDLRSKVIVIQDWSLEMTRVNSANVFTSYGGIECRLIVKSFKPVTQDMDHSTLSRHPVNLYRDDEMKTLIQNYIHGCVQGAVDGGVKENVLDITKFQAKGDVKQGIVSFSSGASFSSYSFKEGKTQTVDLSAIFKQEKGPEALKKVTAGGAAGGKAKVVGGAKKAAGPKAGLKAASKGVASVVEKLAKFTPGGRKSAVKRSTAKIVTKAPTLQSPGGAQEAGTTDHATMKDFRKMISYLKKGKGAAGKKSGKVTGSKLSKKK